MSLIPENLHPSESEAVRLDEILRWVGENASLISFALEGARDGTTGDVREYVERVEEEFSRIFRSVKDSGYELPKLSEWDALRAIEDL